MRRSAFSLVEVLLAVALSAVLLGALYFALALCMDGMQSGRSRIEQAALVRSLFNRMADDVASSLTLVDPARFRLLAEAMAEAEAQGGGAMATPGGSGTGASGASGASGTGSGASGTGSGASGTGSGASGTASGASGTASGASGTANEAAGDPDQMAAPVTNLIPLGVIGDATTLHLYVTKMPHEAFQGALTSDLRRVTYWLGQAGGLCRHEEGVVLSPEALTPSVPQVDELACVMAPEVIGVSFRYFDPAAGWLEAWDSSAVGSDEVTPIGPPRAIEVILTVQPPPRRGLPVPQPMTYRHVIAISTANGPTMNMGGGLLP
ncbi:MAG: prepilin-type N-terminal cleavage/methylation domain-containing protein [Gemmataceae bacterium]